MWTFSLEVKQETNKTNSSLNPLVVHISRKLRFNEQSPSSLGRQIKKSSQCKSVKILVYTPNFSMHNPREKNNYDTVYKFTIWTFSFGLDVPL